MDDLLQLVGVEGTAKAQNKDQKIRRKWAVYLQSLSTSTRSPFFLTEYNPKLSTFAFITKVCTCYSRKWTSLRPRNSLKGSVFAC